MIIKADKEGRIFITAMADYARKICNLNEVGSILDVLNKIEEIPDEKPDVPDKP